MSMVLMLTASLVALIIIGIVFSDSVVEDERVKCKQPAFTKPPRPSERKEE